MKHLLIFSIILVMYSCNNDPIQYTFQGTITDNTLGGGLSGAEVTIYQIPFNNSVTSNNYVLVGSAITDISGNYQIMFEREKVTEFKVNVSKSGYFTQDIIISSADVSSENVNMISSEMDGQTWVKFNIENILPANITDELTLLFYDYREGCSQCITNNYNFFSGEIDTILAYQNTAGQYLKFTYIDITLGQSNTDSIYMTPFDTVSYSIIY